MEKIESFEKDFLRKFLLTTIKVYCRKTLEERREAESEDENGPVIGQKVEEPVVEEAVEEVFF